MSKLSTSHHCASDLNQMEENTESLEQQLILGAKSICTEGASTAVDLNIDFVDFEDTEISYFGLQHP